MNPPRRTAPADASDASITTLPRRLTLGAVVIVLLVLSWYFYLSATEPTTTSAPRWVSQTFSHLSAGGPVEGVVAKAHSVTLPDSWKHRGLPAQGMGRYELSFELPAATPLAQDAIWAVRFDALCRQHRIELNQVLLATTRPHENLPGKVTPALIDIPQGTLKPGVNRLSVEVSCAYQGGLSLPALAPKAELLPDYQRQLVYRIAIPLATNMAGLGFALFLCMLWWLRGEDDSMGLLSAITFVICLSNSAYYVADDLQWHPMFTGWLHYMAYVVACTMFGLFILAFTQSPHPVYKRVLQGALALMTIAGLVSLPFDPQLSTVLTWAQGPMMLLALPCVPILLRSAKRQSSLSLVGFVACSAPMVLTSWHDYYYIFLLGDPTAIHWAPVGYPLALPGLYLVLAQRFALVMRKIEQSNQTLERRVAERTADLAAANAAKSDFLAAASHDLRQPMVAIGLITGMLKERVQDPELHCMTSRLSEAVESMEDLLKRLLDLSRLESGAVEFNPQTVKLQTLFNAIVTHEHEPALAKGIALTMRATTLAVHTDPALLEQILRNLVGNAVRYTERGRVLVAARQRGDRCVIQVWDTGIGIAAKDHKRIFDDFVQLGNPARNTHGGLGLGLALVQRAAKLLGSEVQVQSVPGRGSCFCITLPLLKEREPRLSWPPRQAAAMPSTALPTLPPAATQRLLQAHPLAGLKIMLLEDDRAVRMALDRRLAAWGAQVMALSSLADLDNELQRVHQPHLLVTDFSLGDGTGLQAMHKAQSAWPGLRAIVITGDTSAHHLQTLADCGAPVLHKPFKVEQLLEVLVCHAVGDAAFAA